jgi:thiol-disulfide isomerase/thioredoxin
MKLSHLFFATFILFANSAQALESPTLITKTFDGKKFNLQEKLGHVVIVNFWAQWCIDCRKELPILDEIYAEYKSQGLEIIGVSVDRKKDRNKAFEVIKDKKYPNSMLLDVSENNFDDIDFLPTSYVIDAEGKIAGKIALSERVVVKEDFVKILQPLLQK